MSYYLSNEYKKQNMNKDHLIYTHKKKETEGAIDFVYWYNHKEIVAIKRLNEYDMMYDPIK